MLELIKESIYKLISFSSFILNGIFKCCVLCSFPSCETTVQCW